MAERNLDRIRAVVRLAMTAARIGQTFGWWRIKELPQIEEVIVMLGAILDEYADDPTPA